MLTIIGVIPRGADLVGQLANWGSLLAMLILATLVFEGLRRKLAQAPGSPLQAEETVYFERASNTRKA